MDAFAEYEDLLGPAPAVVSASESRRKRIGELAEQLVSGTLHQGRQDGIEADGGVTVFWLAKHFGLDPSTVRKRIADAPVLRKKSSGHLYSIAVAARYLVDPVVDIESYLKTLRPGDLPENIRASYWDARLKQQKWETNAQHLWHTMDVVSLLGETFVTIKQTMDLWVENLERATEVTEDHRKRLEQMVDALQNEVQEALMAVKDRRYTPASIAQEQEDDFDGLV